MRELITKSILLATILFPSIGFTDELSSGDTA